MVIKSKKTTKKSTKKAPKPRHNRKALKKEFLTSDYPSVQSFLRHKIGIKEAKGWNALKKTTGRAEEKKKLIDDIKGNALREFISNQGEERKKIFEKIELAHIKGLSDLTDILLKQWEIEEHKKLTFVKDKETWKNEPVIEDKLKQRQILWSAEIMFILKHLKLEKWEPTNIDRIDDWEETPQEFIKRMEAMEKKKKWK